jgi:hypothetical protein
MLLVPRANCHTSIIIPKNPKTDDKYKTSDFTGNSDCNISGLLIKKTNGKDDIKIKQ